MDEFFPTFKFTFMKEILLALIGGGAIVQLANLVAVWRPTRRRANAEALGAEVEALERTINVIYTRFESMSKLHAGQMAQMRDQVAALRSRVAQLEGELLRAGLRVPPLATGNFPGLQKGGEA